MSDMPLQLFPGMASNADDVEILIAFFGFFALMSLVALVKFQGNVLFIFSLMLSVASMTWLLQQHRLEAREGKFLERRPRRKRKRS